MSGLRQGWQLPSSRVVLWELPFWAALLYGSLVPATVVTRREWFGVPMRHSDVYVLLSAAYYGCALIAQYLLRRPTVKPHFLLWTTLALFGYGLITLAAGALEAEDKLAMGYTLMLAAAGPLQAAGVLSVYDEEKTRGFLNRLVGFLALLSLLYTAESVFNIGLRSEEGRNMGQDFGMQRVRGPLFGSSTGYLLLLPAIGWSMQGFFAGRGKRLLAALGTAALLGALLGLGSRAALILLVAYALALALMMKQIQKKLVTALLLTMLTAGAGAVVYGRADTQRLQSFEDSFRRTTHDTAWNIVASNGPLAFLTGQGYGAVWSWYRRDALRGDSVAGGDNTIMTGYGISLYHCHSTLLELLVEFGLSGAVWLGMVVWAIVRLPFAGHQDTGWRAFTWALAISLAALGFDLFLFKEVRVNCVWWLFAMAAFRLARLRPQPIRRGA